MLLCFDRWSFPSDIWSLGCIVMEILTGDLFFATHDNREHIALIQKVLGEIPSWMAFKATECKQYFDSKTGKLIWPSRSVKVRDIRRHLRMHHTKRRADVNFKSCLCDQCHAELQPAFRRRAHVVAN